MVAVRDLTGQKFGRLTVVKRGGATKTGGAVWECACECGNTSNIASTSLLTGNTESCGCIKDEIHRRRLAHDLSGQIFGRLTAIKPVGKNAGYILWECQCDCGFKKNVQSNLLLSGGVKSCGCYRRDLPVTKWKGKSGTPRLPEEIAGCKKVMRQYMYGAKQRDYSWELQVEESLELFQGECFYCGVSPSCKIGIDTLGKVVFAYNGIDRKDNNKGYIKDNCVSCCFICNRAKGNMPFDDFVAWIERLRSHKG